MVLEPGHHSLLNNEQRRAPLKYILLYFINLVAWEVKEEESCWKHCLLNKALCERVYGRWDLILGSLEQQKVSKNRMQVLLKEIESHSRKVPGRCWSKMWGETAWAWKIVTSSIHCILPHSGANNWYFTFETHSQWLYFHHQLQTKLTPFFLIYSTNIYWVSAPPLSLSSFSIHRE